MNTDSNSENRRPLKVRDARWAKSFAAWLSRKNITPNAISIGSVICAGIAGALLLLWRWLSPYSIVLAVALPLLAALFIQGRLLCNLFDGMVAVEGGKKTPAGELYNDIPDRIADPLILVAAGYAVPFAHLAALGWLAALLAVLTAYVRTLAASAGAPVSFEGPMAKQHRMAVMTIACVLTALESNFEFFGYSLFAALLIINVGCVVTLINRVQRAYIFLMARDDETVS